MTSPPDRAGAPRAARSAVRLAAALLAAALALAGCANSPDEGETSSMMVGTTTLRTTVTSPATTQTVAGPTSTLVVTPTEPTTIAPPPSTEEPAAKQGECPYLSDAEAADYNGQRAGRTSVIEVEPYPICEFTRQDGRFLAATRIVVAASAQEAAAAVDQHVPVDASDPAVKPEGWTGGSMGRLDGVDGYPDGASIYAVAKGEVAVIAVSNQPQSIKARQMVAAIIENLGL